MASEALGVVRVAREVLSTIVINAALQAAGVIRMAHSGDQWSRLLGRETPSRTAPDGPRRRRRCSRQRAG